MKFTFKITLILILFNTLPMMAQLTITPIVGIDILQFRNTETSSLYIHSEKFKNEGIIFGLRLKQSITKKLFIEAEYAQTNKIKVWAVIDRIIVPTNYFQFDHKYINTQIKFKPINWFSVGLGLNYRILKNIEIHIPTVGQFDKLAPDIGSYEISANASYHFKQFIFSLTYNHGYKFKIKNDSYTSPDQFRYFKHLRSISLTVGYEIDIVKSWRRKPQVNCPTL